MSACQGRVPLVENLSLYRRGTTSQMSRRVYHRLGKLDTLAGLAIRYGVTVPDLKRANGLHSEMGIFALRELTRVRDGMDKGPPPPVWRGGGGAGKFSPRREGASSVGNSWRYGAGFNAVLRSTTSGLGDWARTGDLPAASSSSSSSSSLLPPPPPPPPQPDLGPA